MTVTFSNKETGFSKTVSLLSSYFELTKPRVTLMVMLTAAAGVCLATSGSIDVALLLHAVIGVGLLAAGTAVLNQFLEAEIDSRMKRT